MQLHRSPLPSKKYSSPSNVFYDVQNSFDTNRNQILKYGQNYINNIKQSKVRSDLPLNEQIQRY